MQNPLALTDCTLDLATGLVVGPGYQAQLTRRELQLACFLVEREGEVVSRGALLEHVWGYHPDVVSRTADTTIRRLRHKTRDDDGHPRHWLTVYGAGYRYEGVVVDDARTPELLRGRQEPLRRLERLAAGGGVIAIVGPAGCGKRSLLRAFAEAHPRAGVRVVSDWSQVVAEGLPDGWQVLDAPEDLPVPWELLMEGPDQRDRTLLIPTREEPVQAGVHVFRLGPLEEDVARELFLELAHRRVPHWGQTAPEAVAAIVRGLDGLPGAIAAVAERVSVLTPDQLAAVVGDSFDIAGNARDGYLRDAMAWTIEQLSDAARGLLFVVCTFEREFDSSAFGCLKLDMSTGLDALDELRRWQLVRHSGEGGFVVPRGVRWLVRSSSTVEQLDERRGQAAACLCESVSDLLGEAVLWLDSRRMDHLRRYREDFKAFASTPPGGDSELAARALLTVEPLLVLEGRVDERRTLLHQVLAHRRDLKPEVLAALFLADALLHVESGTYHSALACVAQGLELTPTDQTTLRARLLLARSGAHFAQRRLEQAGEDLHAALELVPLNGALHAVILSSMAQWLDVQGELDRALEQLERALDAHRAREDRLRQAMALFHMGGILCRQNRWYEAESCIEQAVALHEVQSVGRLTAASYTLMANVRLLQGRRSDAEDLYLRSLALHQQAGRARGISLAHRNMGWLAVCFGDDATEAFDAALSVSTSGGDARGAALSVLGSAVTLLLKGEVHKARKMFESLDSRLSARADRGLFAFWSAILALAVGEEDRARALIDQAETALAGTHGGTVPTFVRRVFIEREQVDPTWPLEEFLVRWFASRGRRRV